MEKELQRNILTLIKLAASISVLLFIGIMPTHHQPSSLYFLSNHMVANLLLSGCKRVDKIIQQQKDKDKDRSHDKLVCNSSCREEDCSSLSAEQELLFEFLSNLPDTVVEEVVQSFQAKLETFLMDDMEDNLNENTKHIDNKEMTDSFFGVNSLLTVIQGFQLNSVFFTKSLWFCLKQYGGTRSYKYLSDSLCSSLPGLSCLTSLNISHVADDRIMYTVTRYLNNLISLDISNSRVSDTGLRFFTPTRYPTRSIIRNLEDMMEYKYPSLKPDLYQLQCRAGCPKLEHLNLQNCENITEKGVLYVVEYLTRLKTMKYHQHSSVLEIIIRWSSALTEKEKASKVLNLQEVEHGYYTMAPLSISPHISTLARIMSSLTTITLVTTDSSLSLLAMFNNLARVTLKLEDYLGEGFIDLLTKLGDQLEEVSLSCSDDSEEDLSHEYFVAEHADQQGQLFDLAILSVGLLAKRVTKLSLSGYGLVTSNAVNAIGLREKLDNPSWLRRQSSEWFSYLTNFTIMSYLPAMTVHSGLMRSVLIGARNLKILNIEGSFATFFTDSFLSSILSSNPMERLCILDICSSGEDSIPLTCQTVRQLLDTCVRIREIWIADWRISCACVKELRRFVRENNWDVLITRKGTRMTS